MDGPYVYVPILYSGNLLYLTETRFNVFLLFFCNNRFNSFLYTIEPFTYKTCPPPPSHFNFRLLSDLDSCRFVDMSRRQHNQVCGKMMMN